MVYARRPRFQHIHGLLNRIQFHHFLSNTFPCSHVLMSRSLVCMLLSLERSSSSWVLMNEDTRRLSRMPEEVKTELEPISAFPPRYVRLICMSLFRHDNL